MKALQLYVYRSNYGDPNYDPTNGGISGRYNEIMVPCDRGPFDVDPMTCENLFRIERGPAFAHTLHLVPYNKPQGMVGPMFGGNYATASDSRWGEMLASYFGDFYRYNNVLAIHDRFETSKQYEILSR